MKIVLLGHVHRGHELDDYDSTDVLYLVIIHLLTGDLITTIESTQLLAHSQR